MGLVSPTVATRSTVLLTSCGVAACIALWAALLCAQFEVQRWPFELLVHFRVHYCVGFAAVTLLTVYLRARLLSAVSALGLLISLAPVVLYASQSTPAPIQDAPRFRAASFNVWDRNEQLPQVAAFLRHSEADVIVLQEAHDAFRAVLQQQLPDYPHHLVDPHRQGVVLLSRWPIVNRELISLTPGGVNATHALIDWRGMPVKIIGVHIHWPLEQQSAHLARAEMRGLRDLLADQTGAVLLAGDLNTTVWSPQFKTLLRDTSLTECARGRLRPTWPSLLVWLGIGIDHCFISRAARIARFEVGPHLGSDHRPIIVDVQWSSARTSQSTRSSLRMM